MIFREPPGILQEDVIPLNMIIFSCNSDKKLIFGKKKVATLGSLAPIMLKSQCRVEPKPSFCTEVACDAFTAG
jgi:hypothetical protein